MNLHWISDVLSGLCINSFLRILIFGGVTSLVPKLFTFCPSMFIIDYVADITKTAIDSGFQIPIHLDTYVALIEVMQWVWLQG